jgi:long-chain fatty acid transport protein
MRARVERRRAALAILGVGLAGLLTLAAPAVAGGGFELFSQGAKAAGMAGAFVAQADDPTAIYYNPGGLGLKPPPPAKPKKAAVGLSAIALNEALYQGLGPGPGAGTAGERETGFSFAPHVYAALPLAPKVTFGLGVYSPFLLDSEWSAPDTFAGRFVSTAAEVTTYDLAPTIGFQLGDSFGLGIGAVYRTSEITQTRRLSLADPDTGRPLDVASLSSETDFEGGFGFSAGLLHRPSPRFSWGASYRSAIEIDYGGVARATQIQTGDAAIDALVRATLPLDEDLALATTVELPDVVRLGVAIGLTKSLLLEIDAEQTGWSSLDTITFSLPGNADLDQTIALALDDAAAFRAGLQWTLPTGFQLRVGYAFEESPQPDATVGAFLADSDRGIMAGGVGLDWLQLAFAWIDYDQRIVTTSADAVNGNWRKNEYLIGFTIVK